MSTKTIPEPLKIGEKHDIPSGFRIIANDTSSGRPWMWYCPTLEAAQLLAKTICEINGEDVTICKYVGRVQRSSPPTEFVPADEKPQP